MKPSPLQLERHFFTKIHVDAHPDADPDAKTELQSQVEVAQAERDPKRYQLTLRLKLSALGDKKPQVHRRVSSRRRRQGGGWLARSRRPAASAGEWARPPVRSRKGNALQSHGTRPLAHGLPPFRHVRATQSTPGCPGPHSARRRRQTLDTRSSAPYPPGWGSEQRFSTIGARTFHGADQPVARERPLVCGKGSAIRALIKRKKALLSDFFRTGFYRSSLDALCRPTRACVFVV